MACGGAKAQHNQKDGQTDELLYLCYSGMKHVVKDVIFFFILHVCNLYRRTIVMHDRTIRSLAMRPLTKSASTSKPSCTLPTCLFCGIQEDRMKVLSSTLLLLLALPGSIGSLEGPDNRFLRQREETTKNSVDGSQTVYNHVCFFER